MNELLVGLNDTVGVVRGGMVRGLRRVWSSRRGYRWRQHGGGVRQLMKGGRSVVCRGRTARDGGPCELRVHDVSLFVGR